ncbi:SUMO-activating enzyme subunit 2 [Plasmodium brasilianum]|uniref:SUMO-activating enzyme subunit n=2 Tax=Plasmodium (Plasmodium) TaxID=418103 RepID=A0A1A8WIY3_PLAMA|nr:SUMO-activating enzyme subunit 2, putative [Plasmodium malariae]KAI4835076.1 SUMO-activating enzyme subunit 2 [Plasmodium brasilianum]SBS91206.1 SUMO-activating enzyme subunit 2, putative [Plasmodium malariae]SCP03652.1 SUMO-activating enzyme subunit 2, putative [Plasmodium malariae]
MHKSMRKIFDSKICDKVESMKILLVGAGGIGSEFLKNIITIGCKHIDIIDIDTIDITNLNRQFLFKKKDVKKYKAIVAKERALKHCKDLNINAYTHDVCTMKSSDISKYDYVINALDNIKAREYVNKLCIMEKKILIEAGSTGYNGQVYPIFSNETKCYNCEEKPKNKTYAICTIRQTPSLPEHCVAWGRLIFETFFCKNDNETLIDIKNHIEEESKKRNMEKKEIIIFIFNYLFHDTIKELISLKKDYVITPVPVLFESNYLFDSAYIGQVVSLKDGCEVQLGENPDQGIKGGKNEEKEQRSKIKGKNKESCKGKNVTVGDRDSLNTSEGIEDEEKKDLQLRSQIIWNKTKCIEMYVKSFLNLYNYLNINKKGEDYLIFDKDDDDCINFIAALSNLRMINFSINQKSKFDIQSIAGNIIPAISSTNAIVASLQAVQLIHVIEYFQVLKNSEKEENSERRENRERKNLRDSKAKHVWIKSVVNGNKIFSRGNIVNSENLEAPNPNCYICQQPVINIYIRNFNDMSLYDFVKDVCTNELYFLYPFLDKQDRNIFDYDLFLENDEDYIKSLYNSLSDWDIKNDEILTLTDFQNNKDQLEIHLKHDPSLETSYFIKQKITKKRNVQTEDEEDTIKSLKKRRYIASDEGEANESKVTYDTHKAEEIIIDDERNDNSDLVLID